MNFDHILLEKEQLELLAMVVEASRNVTREKRNKFLVVKNRGGDVLIHEGLGGNKVIYLGDVEALAAEGLVSLTYGSTGSPLFDVTPLGFRYYEHLKQQAGHPVAQVQDEMKSYLDAEVFRRKYPTAYDKWIDAHTRLWRSESEHDLTIIGHLCREAMQEFADSLVEQHALTSVDPSKAHTVARIRAVFDLRASQPGSTERPFFDALLAYWGTVSDLVQRQEHGAQREKEALRWEDARRVTFQTLVVMFEIDKALS